MSILEASFRDDGKEFVEHFGKKGMKWGQRRAAKKSAKADKKWQKNIYTIKGAIDVHNAVADRMNNGGLDKLNGSPKYKNTKKPLIDDHGEPIGKLGRDYVRDYNKLTEKFSHEAIRQVHGISPSGTYKASLDTSHPDQWAVKVSKTNATHSLVDVVLPELVIEVDHDEKGMITLARMVKDSMSQSDLGEEFLAHYGKRGMKWGQRKTPSKQSSDSKKVQQHKGKPVSSLTNKQLTAINTRKSLEQNYRRMNPTKVDKGSKHVKAAIAGGAAGVAIYNMIHSAAGQAGIAAGKKFIKKNVKK